MTTGPEPVLDAARTGTRREMLAVLRDHVAAAIDATTSARALAALSRQFVAVLDEIADIDAAARTTPSTPLAELLARRGDRAAREALADLATRCQREPADDRD